MNTLYENKMAEYKSASGLVRSLHDMSNIMLLILGALRGHTITKINKMQVMSDCCYYDFAVNFEDNKQLSVSVQERKNNFPRIDENGMPIFSDEKFLLVSIMTTDGLNPISLTENFDTILVNLITKKLSGTNSEFIIYFNELAEGNL